jgi:hypothetical protein
LLEPTIAADAASAPGLIVAMNRSKLSVALVRLLARLKVALLSPIFRYTYEACSADHTYGDELSCGRLPEPAPWVQPVLAGSWDTRRGLILGSGATPHTDKPWTTSSTATVPNGTEAPEPGA